MKVFIKNKKVIIGLLVLGALAISSTALASLVDWPNSPLGTPLNPDESTLADFIKYLYEWAIALGGLAAFIALVIAGFQYMSSAGNPAMMQEAKDRIKLAFLGLVLLLGTWLILNIINPELTTLRPVSEGFKEDLSSTIGCKDNAECVKKFGEGYICDEKDKICRQDWENLLRHKPCDKIHILTEGAPDGWPGSSGNEIEIEMGDYYVYRLAEGGSLQILLLPGEKFWYWTEPQEACWGLLQIYEGDELGTRCTKDLQPFLAEAHDQEKMGYGEANATIFCMELVEVPSWEVPDFAHNPRNPSIEDDPEAPPDLPDDPHPKEPAPEACGMVFCNAEDECRRTQATFWASGWCYHAWRTGGNDPNRYYFCDDDIWYSFECKGSIWTSLKCDPDSAWKKSCPGGCDPWSCEKGYGCTDGSGECKP